VQAREIVVGLPDAELGTVSMHNVVPRLGATPGKIRTPAPELGEHTIAILRSIGMSDAELSELRDSRVIVETPASH
jgi:crotonobetainyl-CoA:carnitine CoA-transferase CaiB-like acyl-CoA transferase